MKIRNVKLVVDCPSDSSEIIRKAIASAGGGEIGEYTFCSFSVVGIGRSKGGETTHPVYGEAGILSSSPEERIEVTVRRKLIRKVVNAVLKVHPYEVPTYDVYPLEDF